MLLKKTKSTSQLLKKENVNVKVKGIFKPLECGIFLEKKHGQQVLWQSGLRDRVMLTSHIRVQV